MNNRVYHIEKDVYYNQYGEPSEPTYYIKYETPFLFFFKRWTYCTYRESGYSASWIVRYSFSSLERAQTFIDTVLCKGLPTQKTITEVVGTVQCK